MLIFGRKRKTNRNQKKFIQLACFYQNVTFISFYWSYQKTCWLLKIKSIWKIYHRLAFIDRFKKNAILNQIKIWDNCIEIKKKQNHANILWWFTEITSIYSKRTWQITAEQIDKLLSHRLVKDRRYVHHSPDVFIRMFRSDNNE